MSPFEQLVNQFASASTQAWQQLGVVFLAIAIGAAIGYAVSRRRHPHLPMRRALFHALAYGITFPIATFLLIWVLRLFSGAVGQSVVIKLAVPIFGSLSIIRVVARVLRNLFPHSNPARVLINLTSVVVWFALVMHLSGVLPTIAQELEQTEIPIGKTRVSLLTALQAIALVAVTLLTALWASAAIEAKLTSTGLTMGTKLLLARFLRAALLVLALLFSLSAVGIDLTVLSVFGGALGVGLGLGLQRIAANYVSGFAMLLEGSFRVGDYVRIDNFEGSITQINSRYTVVRAANGRESVIPNETFMTQRVEQSSLSDSQIAVTSTLVVAPGSDVVLARKLMIDAALSEPRVLREPGPGVFVSAFTLDGIELTSSFWIADPENGQLALRSNINLLILQSFAKNGIAFATAASSAASSSRTGEKSSPRIA